MALDPDDTSLEETLGLGGSLLEALEKLPVAMWATDRLGHIRWLNSAAISTIGASVGPHFSRYIGADGVREARELFARLIDGQDDPTTQRTTIVTTLGAAEVELASVPIRNGEGVVGVIAMIRDARPASTARRRPRPRLTAQAKSRVGRAGLEPATLGLKVPCSTS
jgi:PAS domain S-box-containing protein